MLKTPTKEQIRRALVREYHAERERICVENWTYYEILPERIPKTGKQLWIAPYLRGSRRFRRRGG